MRDIYSSNTYLQGIEHSGQPYDVLVQWWCKNNESIKTWQRLHEPNNTDMRTTQRERIDSNENDGRTDSKTDHKRSNDLTRQLHGFTAY